MDKYPIREEAVIPLASLRASSVGLGVKKEPFHFSLNLRLIFLLTVEVVSFFSDERLPVSSKHILEWLILAGMCGSRTVFKEKRSFRIA